MDQKSCTWFNAQGGRPWRSAGTLWSIKRKQASFMGRFDVDIWRKGCRGWSQSEDRDGDETSGMVFHDATRSSKQRKRRQSLSFHRKPENIHVDRYVETWHKLWPVAKRAVLGWRPRQARGERPRRSQRPLGLTKKKKKKNRRIKRNQPEDHRPCPTITCKKTAKHVIIDLQKYRNEYRGYSVPNVS